MLNGHGDDLYAINGKVKYNFSSNVYYKGCPESLLNHIAKCVNEIQSYPSPVAQELNILAANKFQLNSDQFLFTNGATEAFYLIAQWFKGKTASIVAPTFAEYEDACKSFNLKYKLISKSELINVNTNLVFICNPNNPDGSVFTSIELESLFQNNPKTTFIIDEAYIEFTNETTSIISLVQQYLNLIVVRSLTKTFTMPGLRLGYIVSNTSMIQNLLTLKMPWTVNTLAIKAGEFIFEHYEDLIFDAQLLLDETKYFQQRLSRLSCINIKQSYTSYFLMELNLDKASKLKEYLINQHQILVRDATNFNGLDGEYIRVATQSSSANQCLIEALEKWK